MSFLTPKQPRRGVHAPLIVAMVCLMGGQAMAQQKPKPAKPAGAPAAPAAPAPPEATAAAVVTPLTFTRIFDAAQAAFVAKNYDLAVAKINELLKVLGTRKEAPYEMLYFNIGLAHLLNKKSAEAEEAFTDCLKRFPKGEYSSRCYLGIGRACIDQGTPEKKDRAIEALSRAALDPKMRAEAGLNLGELYTEMGKPEDALKVFRSLMGSDVTSPTQTGAAVQVIGLLADTGKLNDLNSYLDRLVNSEGVRDAMAWYVNQVIVRADELVGKQQYASALAIYRAIPPASEVLAVQRASIERMGKEIALLEAKVKSEASKPIEQHSNAGEFLANYKAALEQNQTALTAIEAKTDLDSAILMRRGRCLYYLERREEALVCFKTMRTKYETAPDAKSAAFAEVVLYNELKNTEQLLILGKRYLQKYPDADNAEQVALLAGEIIVQKGDWAAVGEWYGDLIKRFPQSPTIDRYNFYLGVAKFQTGDFTGSAGLLSAFVKNFPNSEMVETALYYVVMANFLTNQYKPTLVAGNDYLKRFPNGRYTGDVIYRLAFIDSNDKTVAPEKIVRDLDGFMQVHPTDLAAGSIYSLLADTAKKMKADPDKGVDPSAIAFEAYKKAMYSESPEDVIQYALDSATQILQDRKDWQAIADLHSDFIKKYPKSNMILTSIGWISKALARMGKAEESTQLIADTLRAEMGNPASELVEQLIDELVKSFVPRKIKPAEVDIEAFDKQLVDLLNKVTEKSTNATTNARIYYARARLAQALKRSDRSDLYLKGIASNTADPAVLSPMLLAVVGDILLKSGKLDEAQAMFQRLKDRYSDSSFSDAGPVGLGQVALARKKPEDALKIFNNAIETIPGMSRFKEASLGKLEALVETGQFETADKLADNMVGDKSFRGESAGKAYLLKARSLRRQSEKAAGIDASRELLKQAKAVYQRVQGAYKASPEVYAEALWQEYQVALELRDNENATKILEFLYAEPKLKNTARYKDAEKLLNK